MKVLHQDALALATQLLTDRGAPTAHAVLQASALLEAELKGHPSHGLQRLPRLLLRVECGLANPRAAGLSEWHTSSVLSVDGERGLGPVIAMAALRQLEQRVVSTGIAMAAIRNNNHLGMLAWYVERAAKNGCIGIALSSSEALVHPHGGTRAMLGTNPLAIAVPTAGQPLVLDLATSTVSMGKIHHHAANGKPLGEGWARNELGQPTTDATHAKRGAIAPFGGAKGYGIGIALELMVAAIAQSALAPDIRGTLDAEAVCNKGDVLIVIQPASASGLGHRLEAYLDAVRASPPDEPGCPVRVPGDGAAQRHAQLLRDGFDVPSALWNELQALAKAPSMSLTPPPLHQGQQQ